MARLLDDSAAAGAGQYFTRPFGGSWEAGSPISMSIWFYLDDLSNNQSIMAYESDSLGDLIRIMFHNNGEIRVQHTNPDEGGTGQNNVAFSDASAWHHAAATFVSHAERNIFLDGTGTSATNSASIAGPNVDRQTVGKLAGLNNAQPMSGGVAEAAIWVNHELTNDQINMLANGYSPMFVFPQQLSYYWPFLDTGNAIDWSSKETSATGEHQDLNSTNGPIATFDHPGKIVKPTVPQILTFTTAAITEVGYQRNKYRYMMAR